jgi:hypothetical protein
VNARSEMLRCYVIPQLCGSLILNTQLILTVYSFSNDQLLLTIKTVDERDMFSSQRIVKYIVTCTGVVVTNNNGFWIR